MNFVYAPDRIDNFVPYWATTDGNVSKPEWQWDPPVRELKDLSSPHSSPMLRIQRLLKNGHECDEALCDQAPKLKMAFWGYNECCWEKTWESTGTGRFRSLTSQEFWSVDKLLEGSNSWEEEEGALVKGQGLNKECADVLNDIEWLDDIEWIHMISNIHSYCTARLAMDLFAYAMPSSGKCSGGCQDRARPLCSKAGKCVTPTCNDVSPYCNKGSKAGLYARMFCPSTCGCTLRRSDLIFSGKNLGCAPHCHKTAESYKSLEEKSLDEPRGSEELIAYARGWNESGVTAACMGSFFAPKRGCPNLLPVGKMIAFDLQTNGCSTRWCHQENGGEGLFQLVPAVYKPVKNFCPASCNKTWCGCGCATEDDDVLPEIAAVFQIFGTLNGSTCAEFSAQCHGDLRDFLIRACPKTCPPSFIECDGDWGLWGLAG